MKIHIFYRHYNIEHTDFKYRPKWFDFENCFINFCNTIDKKDINLHLIMDGAIENNFINKYKDKYILHSIKAGDDTSSAMQTYEIIKSLEDFINDEDLIMLVENDYLHINDWVDKVINLFSTYSNLNYISLYDHNDKYFPEYVNDMVSRIYTTNTHHWRTISSTCGSYIVPKKIFFEDFDIHTQIIGDHNKWLYLNEHKNRFILTPIPGLSTHCMEGLMSPCINWEQINKQINK